ncbi:MAG TPA: chorismate-binding protein [Acidimicrobiales bacterium]|nr:chorismate-binding protein [Acidimicrobiales bacterium]
MSAAGPGTSVPAASHPGVPAALAAAGRLRAATVEVDAAALPDLIRAGGGPDRYLWAKNDVTILGWGEALRLPLPAGWAAPAQTAFVKDALAAIATEGMPNLPGCGPLAIGALPYDPARPGYLTVPRMAVVRRRGRAWVTVTAPAVQRDAFQPDVEAELSGLAGASPDGLLPDRFELTAVMPHEEWKDLVARAVKVMDNGALSKVVLARQVEVVGNRPFVVPDTLARLAVLYPSCAIFHVDGFLGASPETLLRRTGTDIESHPLAGTVARSGDPATDDALVAALMSSAKDRHEHQLVVDEIAAKLRPFASLDVPEQPSILPLRNVSHLGTPIKGTLYDGASRPGQSGNGAVHGNACLHAQGNGRADGAGLPTSLELAAVLQPTPAVGGLPVDAAVEWQRENEGFDRGFYAGPVGWVDREGDGEWVLGLRSATVAGNRAVLYAGNGIVAGSDPDAELAETQLKLQALLAALVRP